MSSLRLDSLRLCWIEAFVAVADAENISEAAKNLGITQPTVSRYVQRLEHWLGKKLIEPGGVRDPENPRVSIALTDEGREFYLIGQRSITELVGFRTMHARCEDQLSALKLMVGKMEADLKSEAPSRASTRRREAIKFYVELVEKVGIETPLDALITINHRVRSDFSAYETDRNREAKMKPKKRPGKINIGSLKL